MTDTTANQTATTKAKTLREDFPSVSFFEDTASAAAFLARMQEEITDLAEVPTVAVGLDGDEETGEIIFDPAKYDGNRVMIAKVEQRLGSGNVQVRAIQISPVPTIDALMNDPRGIQWISKKLNTAINAEAVRAIRKMDADKRFVYSLDDPDLIAAIPACLDDFVSTAGRGSSTLMEGFEELWGEVKKFVAGKSKAFGNRNVTKKQFRQAMQSSAFALRMFPELEETKSGVSVFVYAIGVFEFLCNERGYEGSIFATWKSTREEAMIGGDEDDEDDLSLDDLASELSAKPEGDEAQPAPATAS